MSEKVTGMWTVRPPGKGGRIRICYFALHMPFTWATDHTLAKHMYIYIYVCVCMISNQNYILT